MLLRHVQLLGILLIYQLLRILVVHKLRLISSLVGLVKGNKWLDFVDTLKALDLWLFFYLLFRWLHLSWLVSLLGRIRESLWLVRNQIGEWVILAF